MSDAFKVVVGTNRTYEIDCSRQLSTGQTINSASVAAGSAITTVGSASVSGSTVTVKVNHVSEGRGRIDVTLNCATPSDTIKGYVIFDQINPPTFP